jgi:hypothetical protein
MNDGYAALARPIAKACDRDCRATQARVDASHVLEGELGDMEASDAHTQSLSYWSDVQCSPLQDLHHNRSKAHV